MRGLLTLKPQPANEALTVAQCFSSHYAPLASVHCTHSPHAPCLLPGKWQPALGMASTLGPMLALLPSSLSSAPLKGVTTAPMPSHGV